MFNMFCCVNLHDNVLYKAVSKLYEYFIISYIKPPILMHTNVSYNFKNLELINIIRILFNFLFQLCNISSLITLSHYYSVTSLLLNLNFKSRHPCIYLYILHISLYVVPSICIDLLDCMILIYIQTIHITIL